MGKMPGTRDANALSRRSRRDGDQRIGPGSTGPSMTEGEDQPLLTHHPAPLLRAGWGAPRATPSGWARAIGPTTNPSAPGAHRSGTPRPRKCAIVRYYSLI